MINGGKIAFTVSHSVKCFDSSFVSGADRQWSWRGWVVGTHCIISSEENPNIKGYKTSRGAKRGFKYWCRKWYPKHEIIYIELSKK